MAEISVLQGIFGKRKEHHGTRHFLKTGVEMKANKHPWLRAVWDALIQWQVCGFCFRFPRLMSSASTRLNLNTWMAFKNNISFVIWENKLKWVKGWGKCTKCKLHMCTRQSFLQAAVSSISRVQFTIERGRTETRGQLNNDQRLPIIDKNSFIKAQKSSIIFKVFGTQRFRLQDLKQNSYFSCTSFARPKHLNGFRRQK